MTSDRVRQLSVTAAGLLCVYGTLVGIGVFDHTAHARARATGWWAAASMLLNAGWLLVTQQGWLWVSVGVILALARVLKVIVSRFTALPATGWGERAATDVTFGLYLGWVAVAAYANIAAATLRVRTIARNQPMTG